MNIVQAEENLKKITTKFSKESFIFDLMEAYDFPKSTISKLKIKLKKKPEDDVIVASKLHFVGVSKKELDAKFDELLKDYATVKKQPRFIIVTDYQTIKAYDTKMGEKLDIDIKTLSKHPDFFLPWAGIEKKAFQGENPADVKAAEKLAKFFDLILQDNLKLVDKNRHALNVFLTRILFCFFAEDTDIFEKGLFTKSINDHTNKDGNDLADYLQRLFEVLNKKSRTGLPEYLKEFPYVNGGLFADEFPIPKFSKRSRDSLIGLGSDLNWAEINPDIFGSMIQAVVHPDQRAGLGMHYTSVTNIMKVIEPLFLSELKEEFEKSKSNKPKLKKLLERINNIKVFDPACGSGNFLIIAYKELRLLEIKILKELGGFTVSAIPLSNFYGIEIDDFAHEVAKLSLWLAEHQMDVLFNKEFGEVKASLPLKETGRIVCGNATRLDWKKICSSSKMDEIFILGNPPYVGYSDRTEEQRAEMKDLFEDNGNVLRMDYIGCWFYLASKFIEKNPNSKFSFVSTNSICQGEQVSLIWPIVFKKGLEIFFAHKAFRWTNSAKNNAGVTCVIVGVKSKDNSSKYIYEKDRRKSCKAISPYLIPAEPLVIGQKSTSISKLPEMMIGSTAIDGGNLILSKEEKEEFIKNNKQAQHFIRPFISGGDFIDGTERYCLWIPDEEVNNALSVPWIKKRVKQCEDFRKTKGRDAQKGAKIPWRFFYRKHQELDSIVIPMTSSENRSYLPAGFANSRTIASHGVLVVFGSSTIVFGLISSKMHMIWTKTVAGGLETRIRYSVNLVYNNFPVPELIVAQRIEIEKAVHEILRIRENHVGKSLGELYDSELMPNDLKKAHENLDKIIDSIYSSKQFSSDDERLECLFSLYKKMIESESKENK